MTIANTVSVASHDDDQYTVIWWHYSCVGLSSDTIPDNCWLCECCRPYEFEVSNRPTGKQMYVLPLFYFGSLNIEEGTIDYQP